MLLVFDHDTDLFDVRRLDFHYSNAIGIQLVAMLNDTDVSWQHLCSQPETGFRNAYLWSDDLSCTRTCDVASKFLV